MPESAEVPRISVEIPHIVELLRSRSIVPATAAAEDAPRQCTLQADDGSQLPSFQDLPEPFFPGKSISDRGRQPFADVVIAARVIVPEIERCAQRSAALIAGLVERMREGEAQGIAQTAGRALRQYRLQPVVVREIKVLHGIDVGEVRILRVIGSPYLSRQGVAICRGCDRRWATAAKCRNRGSL